MRFSCIFAALISLTSTCFAEPAVDSSHAVLSSARHFRIQVYESFRTTRQQYDERRAIGDMLIGHWNKAGQPDAWNEELAQWFDKATEASRNNQQLPELPVLLPVATETAETAKPVLEAETETDVEDVEATVPPDEQPAASEPASEEAATTPASQSPAPEAPAEAAAAESAPAPEAANVIESIGGAFWRAIAE